MAAFVHVLSENVLSLPGPWSVLWEQKQIGRRLGLQKAESLAGEKELVGETAANWRGGEGRRTCHHSLALRAGTRKTAGNPVSRNKHRRSPTAC